MEQFIQICIMGGCEYLPSIQGVGLKVALKAFEQHKTIEKVLEGMNAKKKDKVPFNYLEALRKVMTVFLYQTVYNPMTNLLTSLSAVPEAVEIDQEFIGPHIDQNILPDYVKGLLNKSTMEKR